MSIAHDSNDLETKWRDSEFITECLCWHNVYRQRHNAPPLTILSQVKIVFDCIRETRKKKLVLFFYHYYKKKIKNKNRQ